MKALLKAMIMSRLCGAARTPVVGVEGVSVSFDGESAGTPRRLYVKLPTGGETFTDLAGDTPAECAQDGLQFLGLA